MIGSQFQDHLMAFGNPRFHGNGFVQLYLAPDVRLHVWHPDLKPLRDHNASIHNHRYDVRSTIYAGRLLHTTYDLCEDGEHDIKVIQLEGASGFRKNPGHVTDYTARLEVRHSYELAKGSVYTMRRPWFHSSDHLGTRPIVTIFERSNKSTEYAKILCGIDEDQPTHAFDPETQPSQEKMWECIMHALRGCESSAFWIRLNEFEPKGSETGE